MSIKTKFGLLIFVVMIPMFSFQMVSLIKQYNTDIDIELKSNQDYAEAIKVSFQNYLESIWDAEWCMGISIVNEKMEDNKKIASYMKEVLAEQPTVREFIWINKEGTLAACTANQIINPYLWDREYFKEIISGQDKVVSDLLVSRINERATFLVARAIRINGKLEGVIAAAIETANLDTIMPKDRVWESGSFGLIDKNGVFIYRKGVYNIANNMQKVMENSPAARALKGESVISRKYVSLFFKSYAMGAHIFIDNIGWVAFANTPYSNVFAAAVEDLRHELIFFFTITIICLISAINLSKSIINPILVLKESAKEISEGNRNVRTNIEGNDEIAAAAKAFDHMVKSIEELEQLKNQSLVNLSHEFRTPLNIILISLQLINNCEKFNKNEKIRIYLAMMQQNCYRLLRLINNVIDISKLDAGLFKLNFVNSDIVAFIEDITQSVMEYAKTRGISVIFDTDVEERVIKYDPDMIERIMLNLISNSIKFTKSSGSITISINNIPDSIQISVKDTGIGIPEDMLNVIFERFRQVDMSLHREHEGSGIGLSLVKALVEAHGGQIKVCSKLGQGTEFIITIPAVEADLEIQGNSNVNINALDRVQKIAIEFSDIYD